MKEGICGSLDGDGAVGTRRLGTQGKSIGACHYAVRRILLKTDQGEYGESQTDAQVADALSVAAKTVFNVRRRWVEEGLEAALCRKKPSCPSRPRKLDGEAEAILVATCCGPAPEGRAQWTLRLLAGKLVELEVVDSITPETVRRTLKKTRLSPG